MGILAQLQEYVKLSRFTHGVSFYIDSVRVEFSKEYKLERLKRMGQWERVGKNSPLLPKLKQRLAKNEITSAYRLKNQNVYYYNTNKDRPKYRKAVLVVFGMHQQHKEPPPHAIVSEILDILKTVSSVDICTDIRQTPNFDALKRHYTLTRYQKAPSQTHYINDTGVPMLEKVVFYDKAFKNNLQGTLWRIEGTIEIPNVKALALPLSELADIVKIATHGT